MSPQHANDTASALGLRKEVGALIRIRREQAGLTQGQLAETTGRSLELIGKIERGASAPSFETLEALAAALKVPPAAFFSLDTYEAGSGGSLAKVVSRLSKLDREDLEWADELLRVAIGRKVRARRP